MSRYQYENASARWFRWTKNDDVRAHRPARGWEAFAWLLDVHPVTGRQLKSSQWFIRETRERAGGAA